MDGAPEAALALGPPGAELLAFFAGGACAASPAAALFAAGGGADMAAGAFAGRLRWRGLRWQGAETAADDDDDDGDDDDEE